MRLSTRWVLVATICGGMAWTVCVVVGSDQTLSVSRKNQANAAVPIRATTRGESRGTGTPIDPSTNRRANPSLIQIGGVTVENGPIPGVEQASPTTNSERLNAAGTTTEPAQDQWRRSRFPDDPTLYEPGDPREERPQVRYPTPSWQREMEAAGVLPMRFETVRTFGMVEDMQPGAIRHLAVSPFDGSLVVVCAASIARLLEPSFSLRCDLVDAPQHGWIHAVGFKPDGTVLVIDEAGHVRQFNPAGHVIAETLALKFGSHAAVVFQDGQDTAILTTREMEWRVLSADGRTQVDHGFWLNEQGAKLVAAAGRWVVGGTGNGEVQIIDRTRQLPARTVTISSRPIAAIAVIADTIVAGDMYGHMAWIQASDGTPRHTTPPLHTAALKCVAFDPYQPRGASIDDTGRAVIWELDGRVLRIFERLPGNPQTMTWTTNDRLIIGGADGVLSTLDVQTGKLSRRDSPRHTAPVTDLTISADGTNVLSVAAKAGFSLWPTEGSQPRFVSPQSDILSASLSPDGAYIVALTSTTRLIRYSTAQHAEVDAFDWKTSARIGTVAVAPTGNAVACFFNENLCILAIPFAKPRFVQLTTTPRGITWLNSEEIVLDSPPSLPVFGVTADTVRRDLMGVPYQWTSALALSMDRQFTVAAMRDQRLRVWRLAGARVSEWDASLDSIQAVAISHDNRIVVSVSATGVLRAWLLSNGTALALMRLGSISRVIRPHPTDASLWWLGHDNGTLSLLRLINR